MFEDPSNAPMAVALAFRASKERSNKPSRLIRFSDPLDAANTRCVPFDWEHATTEVSNDDIAGY